MRDLAIKEWTEEINIRVQTINEKVSVQTYF